MPGFDDEMRRVRARQDRAMADQASQGSTREGVMLAGVRAALDHAVENLDPDLSNLEAELGVELDAGAVVIGGLCASFAMQGINAIEVAKRFGPMLVEYIEKARARRG